MPTAFTLDLYNGEGTTFGDFARKCARAFVVSADIPEEESGSNSYHADQLEQAEAEVALVKSWDNIEADRQAQLAYERAKNRYLRSRAKMATLRERYEAMLERVRMWPPPTPDHYDLKRFMLDQLRQSIASDCDPDQLTVPKRLDGEAYKEGQLLRARWIVAYHTEHNDTDAQQARQAYIDWVTALNESLPE